MFGINNRFIELEKKYIDLLHKYNDVVSKIPEINIFKLLFDNEKQNKFVKSGYLCNDNFLSKYYSRKKYNDGRIRHLGYLSNLNAIKGEISIDWHGFVGSYCTINACSSKIEIGENLKMADYSHILAFEHTITVDKCGERGYVYKPIKIGNNCWIGLHAIILKGVTLGNNVVVGAGSIVTHSFPDNVVIAGNPAKIIKHINNEVVNQ